MLELIRALFPVLRFKLPPFIFSIKHYEVIGRSFLVGMDSLSFPGPYISGAGSLIIELWIPVGNGIK